MVNTAQAIRWLSNHEHIVLNDNQTFVKCGYKDRIYYLLHRGEERFQTQKIVDLIQTNLEISSGESQQEWLKFASLFIKKYAKDGNLGTIVKIFDRSIISYRQTANFDHPKNQASFEKWTKNGMSADIFIKHPEFCQFLESSNLQSQIKVTREIIAEIDGEPAFLVDGRPMKWTQFKENFECIYSKGYKEKFIIKKSTREVFTFLDNGKGLQKHHPYLTELPVISKLNQSDYGLVLANSKEFVRPAESALPAEEKEKLNASRCFVLQIVSSRIKSRDTNFSNLMTKPQHPYLHLVAGQDIPELNIRKGDVLGLGYEWKNKVITPLVASQGRFRSPDRWEYMSVEERVVTNIPLTPQEAHDLCIYTLKYHRDSVNLGNETGFQMLRHNCTTFIKAAGQAAGITLPIEIPLTDLIKEIAPDWMRKIGNAYIQAKKSCTALCRRIGQLLPTCLKNGIAYLSQKINGLVERFLSFIAALSLAPVNAALGGHAGEGGEAFVPPKKPAKQITPHLRNWKTWLNVSSYRFTLPGILQRWQLQQASTVLYKNPIKLSIVPPIS